MKLEEKRNQVRERINRELLFSLSGPSCSSECDWSAQQLRKWFEHLKDDNLLPVDHSERLSRVISRAECSTVPDMKTPTTCQNARWHRVVDTNARKYSLDKVTEESSLGSSD